MSGVTFDPSKPFQQQMERAREYPPFRRFDIGPFALSIQASEFHYCTPRSSDLPASGYSEFELALFEGGNWITPPSDERFAGLPICERWESGGGCNVGAYIPADEVDGLLRRLVELSAKEVKP